MIWHWFLHITGANNEQGTWYGFWSGFGSDIGEVTIIGGLVAMYRKHTCHQPRCWRLGHHPVAGTPYMACRRHHPALPDKAQPGDITRAYDKARSSQ